MQTDLQDEETENKGITIKAKDAEHLWLASFDFLFSTEKWTRCEDTKLFDSAIRIEQNINKYRQISEAIPAVQY